MSRPVWFVTLIKKSFSQRFWLSRLTHMPPVGAITDQSLFAGDDMVYVPSDRSIVINENINPSEDYVLPSRVVDYFIEKANYHWIMDFCLCRESNQCADYPRQYGCIFLGEAVLKINPRLGHLASKEEALEHARRCREAGLVHAIGRNKRDAIWLGAGPGDKLLTICNCCPCCCLWKVLPEITPRIGLKVKRMPGVEVTVSERCLGCGTCTEGICFVDAIRIVEGQAEIGDECRGCGRCVEICPNEAIELRVNSTNSVGETIQRLSQLVNIG
jgi:NAD-dependent dihydropyrimidine dehydrogenase PreA subunit